MEYRADTSQSDTPCGATRTFADHSRHWESYTYVYPVVSRRSRGLSIGINLNPDTICNFDCVYCQVEKLEHPKPVAVDTHKLREELDGMISAVTSGRIWQHPRFVSVDASLRRINDIAFSGDGEPTSAHCFPEAVDLVTTLKRAHGLGHTKLVLITNATLLNRPHVEAALRVLDENAGEVWAKLDAGTQAYYKQIDRSAVTLQTILGNILACGRRRPIVIQSMFLKLRGEPAPDDEFDAYLDRLSELIDAGCRIKLVQLYTVARKPLESYVTALDDAALSRLAERCKIRLPAIDVQFFGASG
jgi:wyosine [tRNA(Phe)-imidazoG37] synthetase (radical SAM superfamily)